MVLNVYEPGVLAGGDQGLGEEVFGGGGGGVVPLGEVDDGD